MVLFGCFYWFYFSDLRLNFSMGIKIEEMCFYSGVIFDCFSRKMVSLVMYVGTGVG